MPSSFVSSSSLISSRLHPFRASLFLFLSESFLSLQTPQVLQVIYSIQPPPLAAYPPPLPTLCHHLNESHRLQGKTSLQEHGNRSIRWGGGVSANMEDLEQQLYFLSKFLLGSYTSNCCGLNTVMYQPWSNNDDTPRYEEPSTWNMRRCYSRLTTPHNAS
jgi:hypothetical protein